LSTTSGPGHRWELHRRRLYLCTPDRPDLGAFVEACIQGGVDIVQLREKDLPDGLLVQRAMAVQRVCARHQVPFILNDRPELAAEIGADGVHVGQDDMDPATARALVGDDALIGLSTHSPDDLAHAIGAAGGVRAPVDYLSAGPVVPTPTKPGRPGTGLNYIREANRRSPWPVWITGGVDPTTVPDLVAAGAGHFVVVRWLTTAPDPAANARMLRRAIDVAVAGAEEGTSTAGP